MAVWLLVSVWADDRREIWASQVALATVKPREPGTLDPGPFSQPTHAARSPAPLREEAACPQWQKPPGCHSGRQRLPQGPLPRAGQGLHLAPTRSVTRTHEADTMDTPNISDFLVFSQQSQASSLHPSSSSGPGKALASIQASSNQGHSLTRQEPTASCPLPQRSYWTLFFTQTCSCAGVPTLARVHRKSCSRHTLGL